MYIYQEKGTFTKLTQIILLYIEGVKDNERRVENI